jgi:hypothetical protein
MRFFFLRELRSINKEQHEQVVNLSRLTPNRFSQFKKVKYLEKPYGLYRCFFYMYN